MTSTFRDNLKQALESPLPGIFAQQIMAPSVRFKGKGFPEDERKARESAVLLTIYPNNGQLYLVFMKRTEYKGAHSGQVSFPGGKREQNDNDLAATALREAKEELNINATRDSLLGKLSKLYVPASGFIIYPYVVYLDNQPDFIKEPNEVAEIIEVPLIELFSPIFKKVKELTINEYQINAPYYEIGEHHIWGATAMILGEFEQIIKSNNLL